ncbi:MAG: V4R domain-containing protein [Fimbriiglobus sp.]
MSTETASYIRLLNGYFSRPDYFHADVEKGTIRTPAGTRMCTLSDDFLLGFRSALIFECGKAGDRVFKRCGFRWGQAFIQRFDREISEHYGVPARDMSTGLIERALDEAFRYHGWGKLTIDLSDYDHGYVQIAVHDSVMPAVIGNAERPTDALMAGFFAAVFTYYADTELDCIQTECPSRGASASRFVVGLADRIAPATKYVADKLGHTVIMNRLKNPVE